MPFPVTNRAEGSRINFEQASLPAGAGKEYLRWLFTAVTRAKDELYHIGFGDDFFAKN